MSRPNLSLSTSDLTSAKIKEWSNQQVAEWLIIHKLEKYKDNFLENDITGDLLWELNHSLLKVNWNDGHCLCSRAIEAWINVIISRRSKR